MPLTPYPHEQKDQSAIPEGAALFDLIPDALVTVDHSGTIRQVNGRLSAMFGYEERELLDQPIEILLPERVRQGHVHHRKGYQLKPTIRPMGGGLDLYGRRKDGSEFPVDIMLGSLSTSGGLSLAVIRDTSASKKMSEDLRLLAYSDPLTNLPNRAALYRELEELLKREPTTPIKPTSIALFDLDGFKEINDTLGHFIGDQLLKLVAQRWTAVVGDSPQIYRLGGDEFVVLISKCGDPCRVAEITKTMLLQLKTPFEINGKVVYVSASAGIAIAPADGFDVEELIANVDMALYRAKANGPGTCVFFHNTLRAEAQARRDLDLKLRHAYGGGEFELFFQPQVRVADSVLVGAEALLRWRRSNGAVIAPGAFIGALAAGPIAIEVGTWILQTACKIAATWRNNGLLPVRVAVNLFPRQFHDPSFVDKVEKTLADTKLPPGALELEITENIVLSCNAATLAPLHKLREIGVELAFDDFGTGYGSLSFLTQMPLTHIKIDQSFIRGIPDDNKAVAIVRSLIIMAHNIGQKVIAEGVETVSQASFLRSEGCDEAQGFLFAKPLPASEFEALLRTVTPQDELRLRAHMRIASKA
jgi:diguanylate cyclase (GGDEF)-like protein/PAS domain S-box-containing protein